MKINLLTFLGLVCLAGIANSQINAPNYEKLRSNFLNIDSSYYGEIVLNDYYDDIQQDFPKTYGQNVAELKIKEGGYKGWYTFGGTHWAKNSAHGTWSLSRFCTGGSPGNNLDSCGSSVDNSYDKAISCTSCWCDTSQWKSFSGARLWIGAGSNRTFIQPLFESMKDKPANRLCVEFELPEDRLKIEPLGSNRDDGDTARMQLANFEDSHDNLDWLRYEFGTYTTLYHDETSTSDEETGGSFQGGGSHYYHKPARYKRYPMDKAFAITPNTFLACMSDAPTGVRSGMRPSYAYNPLMTVVAGKDKDGYTNAYSYMPHLGRIYFDITSGGTLAKFPLEVKYNKLVMLYEHNDIMAIDCDKGVLGVDMVEEGDSAVYAFTVYNNAPEDRTYRIFMMAAKSSGGTMQMDAPGDHFRIFLDENGNGEKDENEVTEIKPTKTITFTAKTDYHFIIQHNPLNALVGKQRYGFSFGHAGVTFQELNRMRLASYAVRTFIGSTSEVANKQALLDTMIYPSPTSDYATYAQWNHEKENNSRMVKNTPDYKMAIGKMNCTNTSIDQTNNLNSTIGLNHFPNPVQNIATIKYSINKAEKISLRIYNLTGRELLNLVDEYQPANEYSVSVDVSSLTSGVYIFELQVGSFTKKVEKMIIAR